MELDRVRVEFILVVAWVELEWVEFEATEHPKGLTTFFNGNMAVDSGTILATYRGRGGDTDVSNTAKSWISRLREQELKASVISFVAPALFVLTGTSLPLATGESTLQVAGLFFISVGGVWCTGFCFEGGKTDC